MFLFPSSPLATKFNTSEESHRSKNTNCHRKDTFDLVVCSSASEGGLISRGRSRSRQGLGRRRLWCGGGGGGGVTSRAGGDG